MSWGVSARLDGMEDLLDRARLLRWGLEKEIVGRALKAATRPMLSSARANLQGGHGVESGILRQSLGMIARSYRSARTLMVVIGPRSGYKRSYSVSPDRVYVQLGGVKGKHTRSGWAAGIFGKTTRITNPQPGRRTDGRGNITFPTMLRNPTRYAHLTEHGITSGRGGRDAKPFLVPAFTGTKAQAEAIFRTVLLRELEMLAA